MKDIKLLERCEKCGAHLTLMESQKHPEGTVIIPNKQQELKAFRVDDYQTVVAHNMEEAKQFYINELGGEEENFEGYEIDPDNETMWFPTAALPPQYHIAPLKYWDGELYAEVTLRVAMEKRTDKAPYLLSMTSDIL